MIQKGREESISECMLSIVSSRLNFSYCQKERRKEEREKKKEKQKTPEVSSRQGYVLKDSF